MASFYRSNLALSQQQASDQQSPRTVPSRLPTRSAPPTSSSSDRRPSVTRLLKRTPEQTKTPSTNIRVASSRSPGNGAPRHENPSGPLPHPTIPRPPRFDAANTRTPSLVSGSSASTVDSPRSAFLRRKPLSIGKPALRARTELSFKPKSMANTSDEQCSDSVLGIALPPLASAMAREEAMLPHQLLTEDLPPPTPMYAMSASPSTRYSESPGRFSHTSSPTSMSSHSPGIVFPSKLGPRARQSSPTRIRPSVARRKTDEITPVTGGLQSGTSSSSGSTVRGAEGRVQQKVCKIGAPIAQGPSAADRSPRITVQTRISIQSVREAPVYPPPELAHLANAQPLAKPPKPTRPSREGTPDLSGTQDPSPVIQSNLTSLPTTRHRRQGSSTSSRAVGSPFGSAQGSHSRKTSFTSTAHPGMGSSFSPVSTVITTARGTTPDQHSDAEGRSKVSSVPPSPSKTSRFGLFTRRKTETDGANIKEKKPRRGPAAGTGHEGYGRYGIGRGRYGSIASIGGSYGRSPSADSVTSNSSTRPSAIRKGSFGNKSEPEMDPFFKDRLTPVVLRGEGSVTPIAADNARSETSLVTARPTMGMRQASNASEASVEVKPKISVDRSEPTLLPSAMSNTGNGMTFGAKKHRRNGSSDSKLSLKFATRRDGSANANIGGVSKEEKKKEKESHLKTPKKWNFFQRAHSAPRAEPESQHEQKSAPHYAIEDAHGIDMDELEMLMREATRNDVSQPSLRPAPARGDSFRSQHQESILLPSPPLFQRPYEQIPRPASPKVLLRRTESSATDDAGIKPDPVRPTRGPVPVSIPDARREARVQPPASAPPAQEAPVVSPPRSRPSRLPQVGRIPQVVSRRDREQKPSQQSFSRPFAPTRPSPVAKVPQVPQEIPPMPFTHSSEDLNAEIEGPPQSLYMSPVTTPGEGSHLAHEFFAFPSRKYSELSCTSSSGGSFQPSTAVIPAPDAPAQEDEVWNEYDDLIDDVLSSPEQTGKKNTVVPQAKMAPLEQQMASRSQAGQPTRRPNAATQHMRQSRFAATLAAPAASESKPVRLSDDGRGYSFFDPQTGKLSFLSAMGPPLSCAARPTSPRANFQPAAAAGTESTQPKGHHNHNHPFQDAQLMELAEHYSDGFSSMANLRFGALMTSKWLSFGRVLFSPAHAELKNPAEDRVLIIDGLGKDWSYYCALTYPSASVYYLGPAASPTSPSSPSATASGGMPRAPANLRHITYTPGSGAPFPFPRGFFAAAVLRYPLAASDAVHLATVAECKRVLRPGGFLEVSVLDLDLMGMGNRARRAVRGLKLRMQGRDAAVALAPMSDSLVRLVGRRGFEGVKTCVVGVPVAGRVARSRDLGAAGVAGVAGAGTGTGTGAGASTDAGVNVSAGASIDADADGEGIAKMVARVGRWWYSRCYESMVLDGAPSIWADGALLRECERRQTSFRLLVCYAQKPAVVRRRTVSV